MKMSATKTKQSDHIIYVPEARKGYGGPELVKPGQGGKGATIADYFAYNIPGAVGGSGGKGRSEK